MADKKISQLPVATIPLAGTEVLPIVQGGTTDQVSVANLTAGRAVSATQYTSTIATGTAPLVVASTTEVANLKASTAGSLYLTAQALPGAGNPSIALRSSDNTVYFQTGSVNTNVFLDKDQNTMAILDKTNGMAVYGANFVVGTSGKGIDFSANSSAAGMTSELLNWYETGTWTPTLTCTDGAFTSVTYDPLRGGSYTRIGNVVHIQVYMRTDAVDNTVGRTGDVLIAGLPYAAVSGTGGTLSGHCAFAVGIASGWTTSAPSGAFVSGGDTNIQLVFRTTANGSTSNITAVNIGTAANNNIVLVSGSYVCA